MNSSSAVTALSALAQETRLGVFRLLVRAGAEGMPAGRIAERLDVALPTLSFHLKELSAAGLIRAQPVSRFVIYRANFPHMDALLRYLTENCCRGIANSGAGPECSSQSCSTETEGTAS